MQGVSSDARLLQKSAGVITRSIAVHAARAARCTSARGTVMNIAFVCSNASSNDAQCSIVKQHGGFQILNQEAFNGETQRTVLPNQIRTQWFTGNRTQMLYSH